MKRVFAGVAIEPGRSKGNCRSGRRSPGTITARRGFAPPAALLLGGVPDGSARCSWLLSRQGFKGGPDHVLKVLPGERGLERPLEASSGFEQHVKHRARFVKRPHDRRSHTC